MIVVIIIVVLLSIPLSPISHKVYYLVRGNLSHFVILCNPFQVKISFLPP